MPEIIRDIPGLGCTWIVQFVVIHIHIAIYEEGLQQFDDLERNIERNRNQVLEKDNSGPKSDNAIRCGLISRVIEILYGVIALPKSKPIGQSQGQAHDEEDSKIV